jgi:NAD(P)-dependent dehydrogenase (short-subunit alcohol dehydrogenase family)
MAGRLEGKVAIITGGTSGIGRACAIRFAEEGAAVCVAGRNLQAAQQTASWIEQIGQRAMIFAIDVRDESAHDEMVAACAEQLGSVDVLVASAGINAREPGTPPGSNRMLTIPTSVVHDLIQVNLLGAFFSNRAAVRRMIEQGRGGSVVNITSIGAKVPDPGGFYGATKAGLAHLTRVLALEVARHGIRVNAIAPGFIETPMTMRGDGAQRDKTIANVPLKRWGRPEEIANTALFLASEEASFFTGEQLFAAGGLFVG